MNDDVPAEDPDAELKARLGHLRQEHQDLDAAIEALLARPLPDQLMVARIKRRKLALRDEIVRIEAHLLPDIIA